MCPLRHDRRQPTFMKLGPAGRIHIKRRRPFQHNHRAIIERDLDQPVGQIQSLRRKCSREPNPRFFAVFRPHAIASRGDPRDIIRGTSLACGLRNLRTAIRAAARHRVRHPTAHRRHADDRRRNRQPRPPLAA